jgi:L-threonylcarbamoyladenylate synthase
VSKKKTKNSVGKDRVTEIEAEAVEALRRGEVIVFPTETFYGLGAAALDGAAVERVVSLKGRSPENPISVIIADQNMLKSLVDEIPSLALRLMERFWPGPLTLVFRAKKGLPEPLLNREGGIGVRISSHPIAARLTHGLGKPLTATSANPSGKEPARTLDEAKSYFSGRIRLFVDGGRLTGTKGSTVADITGGRLKIIREGAIDSTELQKALGRIG